MKIGGVEVLTLEEAAARLGLASSTLRHQIRNGALAAERLGGRYVVTAEAVEAYAQEHRGKHGFAAPSHPLRGRQGPGHRQKRTPAVQD
jgi:excisionase family DNA binding protein